MDRRQFLTHAAAVAAIPAAARLAPLDRVLSAIPARADTTVPPNVVLFVADDLSLAEAATMDVLTSTLAAAGTRWDVLLDRPVCQPSRACLLTGQTVSRHKVGGNSNAQGDGLMAAGNLLPAWLQAAGYFTAVAGKLHNSLDVDDALPPGFDEVHGHTGYGGGTGNTNYVRWAFRTNAGVEYGTRYLETETAARAVRCLDAWHARAADRPFFLWVGSPAPHEGTGAAPPSYARVPVAPPVWPPSFDETDVSDKPAWVRRLPRIGGTTAYNSEVRNWTDRARRCMAVEDTIRTVLGALSPTELANTVVLFTSDNGWMHGEHRIRGGKTVHYRESSEVVLYASGPGFASGVRAGTVGQADIPTTICAVAGAVAGRPYQTGIDLRSGLADASDRLLYSDGNAYDAVRDCRYKYVRNVSGEIEFYDLIADPWECRSLHADPAYAADVARYAAALTRTMAAR